MFSIVYECFLYFLFIAALVLGRTGSNTVSIFLLFFVCFVLYALGSDSFQKMQAIPCAVLYALNGFSINFGCLGKELSIFRHLFADLF